MSLMALAGFTIGVAGTLYLVAALFASAFDGPAPRPSGDARVRNPSMSVPPVEAPVGAPAGALEDETVFPSGTGETTRSRTLSPDSIEVLLEVLRDRDLLVPVEGVDDDDLDDHFDDPRGDGRYHFAIDILAPRGTPVVGVEDGRIVKLYLSNSGGGIAIYQFDPSQTFGYYYAHLDRYAAGLEEGDLVRKGEVIGYVGTTGNAAPGTPHLHFAITLLTPEKRWWEGIPLNPYPALK
jgi:murein DD-endopeptidase MepM/ murein hydrolase activator NlpD